MAGSAGPILGIDLGTRYLRAGAVVGDELALLSDGGSAAIPSVVHLPPSGDPVVGAAAAARALDEPERAVSAIKQIVGCRASDAPAKRLAAGARYKIEAGPNDQPMLHVGGRKYTPPVIVGMLLSHVRTLAEQRFGQRVRRAVMVVPAGAPDAFRRALNIATSFAELEVARLLEAPVACALALGKSAEAADRTFVVCDCGAGALELTLVVQSGREFECAAVERDLLLGGDAFDERLAGSIADLVQQQSGDDVRERPDVWQALLRACEAAKRTLAGAERASVAVAGAYTLEGTQRDISLTLSRGQASAQWRPLLEGVGEAAERLTRAGARAAPSRRIDEVLLVGGGSPLPALQHALAGAFEAPASLATSAEVLATVGAAHLAAALG